MEEEFGGSAARSSPLSVLKVIQLCSMGGLQATPNSPHTSAVIRLVAEMRPSTRNRYGARFDGAQRDGALDD